MATNFTNGDVLLLSSEDGGDLDINDGIITMTGGFETAAFLSLFGGNFNDDGTTSTQNKEWWGNKLDVNNPNRKMTSRTQNILKGYPATPGNLNLVEQAIRLDLNWMIENSIIDELIITLTIPSKNKINIALEGKKDRNTIAGIEFEQNWLAQSA